MAVTGLRTAMLPRWLAVASLLGGLVAVAGAASYDGAPFEALGLAELAWFLLRSLASGVVLAVQNPELSATHQPVTAPIA